MEPLLLSAEDAAALLSVGTYTVEALTRQGQLPAVKVGKFVRYRPADLRAYVDRLGGPGRTAEPTMIAIPPRGTRPARNKRKAG
jgi:excisionase family DNA binding protein